MTEAGVGWRRRSTLPASIRISEMAYPKLSCLPGWAQYFDDKLQAAA